MFVLDHSSSSSHRMFWGVVITRPNCNLLTGLMARKTAQHWSGWTQLSAVQFTPTTQQWTGQAYYSAVQSTVQYSPQWSGWAKSSTAVPYKSDQLSARVETATTHTTVATGAGRKQTGRSQSKEWKIIKQIFTKLLIDLNILVGMERVEQHLNIHINLWWCFLGFLSLI